jgi:hypothetical protein
VKTCFHKKCGVFEACKKVKDFFDTLTAPHGDAAFFSCCCRQIVPVTVKTAVPGVIVQSPVAASCV